MINAPSRPTCSVLSAPTAAVALPSSYRPATVRPCSFIWTRSPPKWRLARMPLSSSIKPAGTVQRNSGFQPISRSCRCHRAHPSSTARKYLAVHAAELAVEPDLQILRRHRRSLLLRLEHAYRPAVEDHVRRATRLGDCRSLIMRIGISWWSGFIARPLLLVSVERRQDGFARGFSRRRVDPSNPIRNAIWLRRGARWCGFLLDRCPDSGRGAGRIGSVHRIGTSGAASASSSMGGLGRLWGPGGACSESWWLRSISILSSVM